MPQRTSIPSRTRRLVRLSSTTSTFTSRSVPGVVAVPLLLSWESVFFNFTVKWNVVPVPSSLSAHTLPPIISTRRWEIVSPSPVPPYFRVAEVSACEKASKMDCIFSLGIPTPVSETEK